MNHYILEGKEIIPCDVITWGRFLETGDRVIGRWGFASCDVSTVFLGMDHRFGRPGPPLVFETLIFGGPLDDTMERYATYDEAELGHMYWCGQVVRYEATTHWRKIKRWRNKLARERRLRGVRMERVIRQGKARIK